MSRLYLAPLLPQARSRGNMGTDCVLAHLLILGGRSVLKVVRSSAAPVRSSSSLCEGSLMVHGLKLATGIDSYVAFCSAVCWPSSCIFRRIIRRVLSKPNPDDLI